MQLSTAQKTTLAAHINANTNTCTLPGGFGTQIINTGVAGRDPIVQQGIANWYNQAALAGDNQPFANINVWNAITTIAQLNSAVKWQTAPVGATAADVSNSWLLWQTMLWNMSLDMGDGSVRKGMLQVFGDVLGGSAVLIGAVGCGQQVGKNIELVLSGNVVGATTALVAAHVVQKDAATPSVSLYSQLITQVDIDHALFPNG